MEALVRISVSIFLFVLSPDVYSNECFSFSFSNNYSLIFFFFKMQNRISGLDGTSPCFTSMFGKWAFSALRLKVVEIK